MTRPPPSTVHFSGGIRFTDTRGYLHERLLGWPACRMGGIARQIRREGRMTDLRGDVTCKACRGMMRRAGVIR